MRTLTKFTLITGLSFGVNMVMLLARSKAFAILLEPEGVGVLSQVTTIEGLIASFATIGIGYGITNLIAKGPKNGEANSYAWSVVRTGQWIAIAIAIPVFAFLLVFSKNISEITIGSREFGILFVIIAITIPLKFNAAVFNSGLQGLKQIVSLAWVRSLAAILGFLCILPLTYYTADQEGPPNR